jgi:hypothetical protein
MHIEEKDVSHELNNDNDCKLNEGTKLKFQPEIA